MRSELRVGQIEIAYAMDDAYEGSILIGLPDWPGDDSSELAALFDVWAGAFLAQLCLARTLNLPNGFDPDAWTTLSPVVQHLYDVRAYRDSLSLMEVPTVVGPVVKTSPLNQNLDPMHSILLWSGGVDSTLAEVLLRANYYRTTAVHVQLNEGAIAGETRAVTKLAQHFRRDVEVVTFDFPQFLDIACRYSDVINHFPIDNAIPHGRELVLIPIGIAVGSRGTAGRITLGHEYNAWKRHIAYQGRDIPKCDTQSEASNIVLDDYLARFYSSGLHLFSPVAALSDYLKFKLLAQLDLGALECTSACFWGRNCGVCAKCTLHYLLQRALSLDVFQFRQDPLTTSTILRRMILEFSDRSQTNWREMQVALCSIIRMSAFSADEELLVFYASNAFPVLRDELALIELELSTPQPVALLPQRFRYDR